MLYLILNLYKEFRFLYRFGTVFHIILPLKHNTSAQYREVFVFGNLSTLAFLIGTILSE